MNRSVLVVGGGPVGLAVAIGLRRWGVECVVVERHPAPLAFPKGRGVSTRTMEIFRQWGLEEEITAAGLPRAETEYFFVGETLLASQFQRFDRADMGRTAQASPTERLICAQDLVERVLLDHVVNLGVEVRFDNELVGLVDGPDGVIATIRDRRTGQANMIEAAYLVAADGGRSTARHLLGVGMTGPGAVGDSVSILVHAELGDRVADRLATIYKVAHPHPSAAFPVVDNDHRWLLMMARDPVAEPNALFTEEHCLGLVRTALGDDTVALDFQRCWFFQPTSLVADHFRIGRVFLAGDAAHLATPFGALGMNCGIADAHNLAWKIAGVLDGWAAQTLLDTYETERRPVAIATSDASILRADVTAGPPRAAFDGITLGYRYESEAIVPDGTADPEVADPVHDYMPTARPGRRAPHTWLDIEGTRCSTLDLFGETFTLLVAASHPPPPVTHGSVPLRTQALGGTTFADDYGLAPGGMALVRPDGHIAWRSPVAPDDAATTIAAALRQATMT